MIRRPNSLRSSAIAQVSSRLVVASPLPPVSSKLARNNRRSRSPIYRRSVETMRWIVEGRNPAAVHSLIRPASVIGFLDLWGDKRRGDRFNYLRWYLWKLDDFVRKTKKLELDEFFDLCFYNTWDTIVIAILLWRIEIVWDNFVNCCVQDVRFNHCWR